MCIICASWKNNELKLVEAWSNYAEMREDLGDHAEEVNEMLTTALDNILPSTAIPIPPKKVRP